MPNQNFTHTWEKKNTEKNHYIDQGKLSIILWDSIEKKKTNKWRKRSIWNRIVCFDDVDEFRKWWEIM